MAHRAHKGWIWILGAALVVACSTRTAGTRDAGTGGSDAEGGDAGRLDADSGGEGGASSDAGCHDAAATDAACQRSADCVLVKSTTGGGQQSSLITWDYVWCCDCGELHLECWQKLSVPRTCTCTLDETQVSTSQCELP